MKFDMKETLSFVRGAVWAALVGAALGSTFNPTPVHAQINNPSPAANAVAGTGLNAVGSTLNVTYGETASTSRQGNDGTFPYAITSTVSTGTAPFIVASTTQVSNLNVSQLAGCTWAIPCAIGTTTPSSGAFTTLSATTTNPTLTFTSSGTGAVARNYQSKLGDIVSGLDFGCDPTGALDSTTCLTSAATYLGAAGGTIYLPKGTYAINTSGGAVILGGLITIEGAGPEATIIENGTTNGPAITFGNGSTQYYGGGFKNIGFGGKSGVTGVSGQLAFQILKTGQFLIDNVKVTQNPNSLYAGVLISSGSQFKIDNLEVQNTTTVGIELLNSLDMYVHKSRADSNGTFGWWLNASQGGYFVSDTGYNNTSSAWNLASTTPSSALNINNWFIGCVGDTSGSYNWVISDSKNSYFVNDWGSTQQSTGTNTFATGFIITSQYAQDLFFLGGSAINNNSHGVSIYDPGSSAPQNIHFVGFQFGSTSNGSNGNGKSGSGYGITWNGVVNHTRVEGGSFAGNASGAWSNGASTTDNLVTGMPYGAFNNGMLFGGAFGFTTGAGVGGTVTQATSKTTGVTLNTLTGQITMNNAALAASSAACFVLTNSQLVAGDTLIVNMASGGTVSAYEIQVAAIGSAAATICVYNHSAGSLSEAIVLNFNDIRGSTN